MDIHAVRTSGVVGSRSDGTENKQNLILLTLKYLASGPSNLNPTVIDVLAVSMHRFVTENYSYASFFSIPFFLLQLFQNILASTELHFPSKILKELHPDCVDLCRSLLRRNPGIYCNYTLRTFVLVYFAKIFCECQKVMMGLRLKYCYTYVLNDS